MAVPPSSVLRVLGISGARSISSKSVATSFFRRSTSSRSWTAANRRFPSITTDLPFSTGTTKSGSCSKKPFQAIDIATSATAMRSHRVFRMSNCFASGPSPYSARRGFSASKQQIVDLDAGIACWLRIRGGRLSCRHLRAPHIRSRLASNHIGGILPQLLAVENPKAAALGDGPAKTTLLRENRAFADCPTVTFIEFPATRACRTRAVALRPCGD